MKKLFVMGIILLLVGMSFPSTGRVLDNSYSISVEGKILYVGGSGPGNYTRIRDAIANASNGDTVFVYSGIYNETLDIMKGINLIGENRLNTVISGKDTGKEDVVYIGCNLVKISGFTIQYGLYTAVRVWGKLRNCEISNNSLIPHGYRGVLLEDDSTNIVIRDNIITNCTIVGIDAYQCISCVISNNTIYNNFLGIFVTGRKNKIINNDVCYNEYIGITVGGLLGSCLVRRNNIVNNQGGGLVAMYFVYITQNNFINNSYYGSTSHALTIWGFLTRFHNNYWDDWKGHGIKWVRNVGDISIPYTPFYGLVIALIPKFDLSPAKEPFDI